MTLAPVGIRSVPAWRLACVVLAVALYRLVGAVKSMQHLWLANSLIYCGDGSPGPALLNGTTLSGDGLPLDEQNWSGSIHCNDLKTVALDGQQLASWGTAITTFFGIFCGPALGALSDRIGRRPVLLAGTVGAVSATMLYAMSAAFSNKALFLIGACVAGSTDVVIQTIFTMVVDTHTQVPSAAQKNEGLLANDALSRAEAADATDATGAAPKDNAADAEMGKDIVKLTAVQFVAAVSGSGVGFYFVSQNLTNFAPLFFGLGGGGSLIVLLCCVAPETLPRNSNERTKGTLVPGENLVKDIDHILDDPKFYDVSSSFEPDGGAAHDVDDTDASRHRNKCAHMCSPLRSFVESPVVRIMCVFVFMLGVGGSAANLSITYLRVQFGFSQVDASAWLMTTIGTGSIAIALSSSIIRCMGGALRATQVGVCITTLGVAAMALSTFGFPIFVVGLWTISLSGFLAISYQQYIAARIDAANMGAVQGLLGTFARIGSITGSLVLTYLMRGPLEHTLYVVYIISAGFWLFAAISWWVLSRYDPARVQNEARERGSMSVMLSDAAGGDEI